MSVPDVIYWSISLERHTHSKQHSLFHSFRLIKLYLYPSPTFIMKVSAILATLAALSTSALASPLSVS